MKTFDINEKIVVSIDPDSAEFAGRVFDTLSAVDKKQRRLIRAKGIASADYYDLSNRHRFPTHLLARQTIKADRRWLWQCRQPLFQCLQACPAISQRFSKERTRYR